MKILIFIVVIIFISIGRVIDYTKYYILYHPVKEHINLFNFGKITNSKITEINIINEDENIHGWFIQTTNDNFNEYPTLLISHGNAGNISHRSQLIETLMPLKVNLCLYDYSGYGKSNGYPSENKFYSNLESVYNYLVKILKIPSDKIILFGESIGCAVASNLAYKLQTKKLILLSGFSSIKDMFEYKLPNCLSFLKFLSIFIYEFPSINNISKYNGNTLILHSKSDEMIPYQQAINISQCNHNCQLLEIFGSHNNPIISETIIESMKLFINK